MANNAIIYCRDDQDNTLLHLAIQANHLPSVTLLLEQDADPNTFNNAEETPLMTAIKSIPCDLAIIMLLLRRWADPRLTNQAKETPLYQALIHSHHQNTTERLITLLQYTNINEVCAYGMRPLEHALSLDDPLLVATLIRQGADIEQRDDQGKLIFSIDIYLHSNYKSIIDYLLSAKRNALKNPTLLCKENAKSTRVEFRTLLNNAILDNHYNLVIAVLRYININEYDTKGYTPLLLALNVPNIKATIIQAILNRNPDLNNTDPKGNTPLHLAITRHTPNIVGALLMHGANPNTTSRNQCKPLFTALKQTKTREQNVRLLLAWGAKFNLDNYLDTSKTLLEAINNQLTTEETALKKYNRHQSKPLTRLLLAEPGIKTWIMERQNALFFLKTFKTKPFPKELHDYIIENLVPEKCVKEIQQWPIHCNRYSLNTPSASPMLG